MRFAHRVLIPMIALGLVVAAVSSQGQLYQQPLDPNGSLFASQNDTAPGGNGPFATLYDNFTLGSNASIGGVSWYGGYWNPSEPGAVSQFTLSFWSDLGGQPNTLLASTVIAGIANQKSEGPCPYGGDWYSYGATLSTPFQAVGGVQYWLSIVPDMPFPPQWGWATSAQGDGKSYQDFFQIRSLGSYDLAFSLDPAESPEVPEGSSAAALAALMGFGLAGLRKLRSR